MWKTLLPDESHPVPGGNTRLTPSRTLSRSQTVPSPAQTPELLLAPLERGEHGMNLALRVKPATEGTNPIPHFTHDGSSSSTEQNTAELTELSLGQWTKEDYSRVIKRLKSGTNSNECTERKIPGEVPATGWSPNKPTNNKTQPTKTTVGGVWKYTNTHPQQCPGKRLRPA